MGDTDTTTNRPDGRRGSYATGRRSQQEIIEAARTLFAARGYGGTSLRDIAAAAGVTAGNITHHFGSKQGLLISVLDSQALDSDVLARTENGDLASALRELVTRNQQLRTHVELFVSVSAEATDPSHPAHSYIQQRYALTLESVRRGVEAARAHGNLPDGPPSEIVARSLVAVLDGLQVQWLLDPTFEMATVLDAHFAFIGATRGAPPTRAVETHHRE